MTEEVDLERLTQLRVVEPFERPQESESGVVDQDVGVSRVPRSGLARCRICEVQLDRASAGQIGDVVEVRRGRVRKRDGEVTPAAALRPLLDRPVVARPCTWEDLQDSSFSDRLSTWLACERTSPALSVRRTTLTHGWGTALGVAAGSRVWGAFAAATILLRHETFRAAMLSGEAPAKVRGQVRETLDVALAGLDGCRVSPAAEPPRS